MFERKAWWIFVNGSGRFDVDAVTALCFSTKERMTSLHLQIILFGVTVPLKQIAIVSLM